MNTIEQVKSRIDEQAQQQFNSVQEISLDQIQIGQFNGEIAAILENFGNSLQFLSLNDCSLTDLNNFPYLPKLTRLELVNNKVSGTDLVNVSKLVDLQSLSLAGNPLLKSYDDISCLTQLPQLMQIDLFECPISENPDYRDTIFTLFKELQILDNKDRHGEDLEDDDGMSEEDDDDDYGAEDMDEEYDDEYDFEDHENKLGQSKKKKIN